MCMQTAEIASMARTLLLCVAAIRTAAAVSAKCSALGPTDVVVFIDLQNCFKR